MIGPNRSDRGSPGRLSARPGRRPFATPPGLAPRATCLLLTPIDPDTTPVPEPAVRLVFGLAAVGVAIALNHGTLASVIGLIGGMGFMWAGKPVHAANDGDQAEA